jgi:hypothetical protein
LLSARLRRPWPPHLIASWATWDLARQSAGAWLREHTTGTELFATFEGLPAFEYAGPCYDFSSLNSVKDERRRRSAAYQLDGPLPLEENALPMDERGTGRKLVATFRYDTADKFYLLYAKPGSEIDSNGMRNFLFPTPTLWAGAPGLQPRQRAAQDENTWYLPATGLAHFEVHSPGPPTVMFASAISRERKLPAVAGDSVHLAVSSEGVELYSGVLAAGDEPKRVGVTASRRSETDEYTFEIETRSTGTQESRELLVEASEVEVRYGEPLESKDFKLTFPRCRSRIDHVAAAGLPRRVLGW